MGLRNSMMVAFMLALAALTATAGRVDDDVHVGKDVEALKKKKKQQADEEEDQAQIADSAPEGDDVDVPFAMNAKETSVSKILKDAEVLKGKEAKDMRELLGKAALSQAQALHLAEANDKEARDKGVEAARAHGYHQKIEAAYNKAVKDATDTANAEAPARANAEDAEKAEKKVSEEWTAADSLREDTLHEKVRAEAIAKKLNKVTAKDKEIHDAAQVKAQEKAALAATAFEEEATAKTALDEATKNKQAAYAIVREKALHDNECMKEVSRTQRVKREETNKMDNTVNGTKANLQGATSHETKSETEAQQAKASADEAAEYALAGHQVNLQAQQTASDVEDEASSDRALAANVDKYKMITDQVMNAEMP